MTLGGRPLFFSTGAGLLPSDSVNDRFGKGAQGTTTRHEPHHPTRKHPRPVWVAVLFSSQSLLRGVMYTDHIHGITRERARHVTPAGDASDFALGGRPLFFTTGTGSLPSASVRAAERARWPTRKSEKCGETELPKPAGGVSFAALGGRPLFFAGTLSPEGAGE